MKSSLPPFTCPGASGSSLEVSSSLLQCSWLAIPSCKEAPEDVVYISEKRHYDVFKLFMDVA